MRRLTVFVAALLMMVPGFYASGAIGAAQGATPFGMAVVDVTFFSSCSITYRTYATRDIGSEIVDEQVRECPAGTVIWTTPVDSEKEALELGGIFVPLSGNVDADFSAVQSAKSQILPADTRSYSQEQTALTGCVDRSFSRSLYYRAYEPGVDVYGTVYYWQDFTCASGLSSAVASMDWDADVYWRFAEYFNTYYYNSHGCTNLSTGATYDTYNVSRPLGGLYRDESINEYPCWTAAGESYTDQTYL